MPIYPPGSAKSDPGQVFHDQLTALADYAEAANENSPTADFYRPKGLTKSLTDIESMHDPFDRSEHEEDFRKAVTKPQEPGTVGDLSMSQIQGDVLHCLERAFRARHHTSCRTRIHPLARLRGHGFETGVIRSGLEGYITNLDKLNKGTKPTDPPPDDPIA